MHSWAKVNRPRGMGPIPYQLEGGERDNCDWSEISDRFWSWYVSEWGSAPQIFKRRCQSSCRCRMCVSVNLLLCLAYRCIPHLLLARVCDGAGRCRIFSYQCDCHQRYGPAQSRSMDASKPSITFFTAFQVIGSLLDHFMDFFFSGIDCI